MTTRPLRQTIDRGKRRAVVRAPTSRPVCRSTPPKRRRRRCTSRRLQGSEAALQDGFATRSSPPRQVDPSPRAPARRRPQAILQLPGGHPCSSAQSIGEHIGVSARPPFSSARAPGSTIELIDRSRRISRSAPLGQGCRGAGCQADLIHWPVISEWPLFAHWGRALRRLRTAEFLFAPCRQDCRRMRIETSLMVEHDKILPAEAHRDRFAALGERGAV